MGVFDNVDPETKARLVRVWERMGELDRDFFVDQVALALSIWGSDETGRDFVANILSRMMDEGSHNLSDFGLYVETAISDVKGRHDKIRKAGIIIDDYRMKNALSSVPHKDIGI